MKNLILVSGTMGVGKTATCLKLSKILPHNVYLDGDWCWKANPFIVNESTKSMVLDNIGHLLNNFVNCPDYQNIIFSWVMDEQSIFDDVISKVSGECNVYHYTLMCSENSLSKRIEKDVACNIRNSDSYAKSVLRLNKYTFVDSVKINTDDLTAEQVAKIIAKDINS